MTDGYVLEIRERTVKIKDVTPRITDEKTQAMLRDLVKRFIEELEGVEVLDVELINMKIFADVKIRVGEFETRDGRQVEVLFKR